MSQAEEGEAVRVLAARYADCSNKLAAREKRMREVAEEMIQCATPYTPGVKDFDTGVGPDELKAWAAKLLEGLGESASKKEDA